MDAAALLRAQGWRGKGFSLHPTDNGIGLAKPLLLSRNSDGRGIGTKQHHTSDQWWLHAFDQKLKGLDTSKGAVVQSVTQGKLDAVIATGNGGNSLPSGRYTGAAGLYASFVRGEMLKGTMEVEVGVEGGLGEKGESTDATPASSSSDDSDGPALSKKKQKKEERRGESKAERQARRAARRLRKAEKAARKAAEVKAARKAAGKIARKEAKRAAKANETKEERRARRADRRARKEAKRRIREGAVGQG